MLITKELLEKHGACKNQLDKFVELFPDGVVPTRELCLAHAQTFNFTWAHYLLSPPARKAYDEAIAPARKARDEAIAPVRKAYNEALVSAWKAYDEAVAPAWKAYNEAIAAAWFDASQKE